MRRLRGEIHDSYLGRSRIAPERATAIKRWDWSEKSAEAVVTANSANREGLETGASWAAKETRTKGRTVGRANQQ